jgi:hypothetical protein
MDLFGSAKKTKKATKTKKTTKTTKTSDAKKTKKSTTTRSKSKAKGGNFLGTVGDLVAPTGWGPFATAAGLLALDRVDAALRRGTKEKKEKMKGGKKSEKKMKGGEMTCAAETLPTNNYNEKIYKVCCDHNGKELCEQTIFNTKTNVTNTQRLIILKRRIEQKIKNKLNS